MRSLSLVLGAALLSFILAASAPYLNGLRAALSLGIADAQSAGNCGLRAPAFCDTFDSPYTGGGRSGQLDPTRWSIARVSGMINPGQGMVSYFPPANAMHCKTPVSGVVPPHDYFVCGAEFGESNHFMEAFDDGGNYVFNDARVRQPFDFAGRTGTVTYDVDAKNAGGHGWWTEFWLTDEPISGPHKNQVELHPRNGIGLEFSDPCGGAIPSGTDGSPLGGVLVVRNFHNYAESESVPWQAASDGLTLHKVSCYQAMPDMQNHFEIRVSQTHLEVWATDAGPSGPLKQIATVDGINLPFTRGFVHFQHAGYNAEKAAEPSHVSHAQTYHWDNVGFDGPVLPVPAQYSIPDSLTPGPNGGINVGYVMLETGLQSGPRTFTGVSLGSAKSAALSLDVRVGHPHFKYRLNGGAWHQWELASNPPSGWNAALIPIDLGELRTGDNTIDLGGVSDGATYPDQNVVNNIDLILNGTVGTSTGPSPAATSTPAPVPPTSTPKPAATNTPPPAAPANTRTATPANTPAPTATPPGAAPGGSSGGTLGLTSVGSVSDRDDSNYMNGTRVVVGAQNEAVSSMSVYVGAVDAAPHTQFALAIYTDVDGAPGSLVAQSAVGTLKASNTWNRLPINATLRANGAYWLMFNTNGSNGSVNNMNFNPGQNNIGAFAAQAFGQWPMTIRGASQGEWRFSIYATVSP